MISINRATILGNLTRDPELRYTPSGQAVCNFSVATNRRFKNSQGDLQEDTQYHDVVAWGKLAEVINQILSKGNKVYVDGRLQTRQWEAPDGGKRSKTEIILDQFVPLSPRAYSESNDSFEAGTDSDSASVKKSPSKSTKVEETEKPTDISAKEEDIDLDDIPF